MSHSRRPGSLGLIGYPSPGLVPPRTPGPLGINDQGDPNRWSLFGDTPGSTGYCDSSSPLSDSAVARSFPTRRLIHASSPSSSSNQAPAATVGQPSGAAWVSRFPGRTQTADLEEGFRANVKAFLAALDTAKAHVNITSTLRPPERAFLMHWSWKIVKEGYDPKKVPKKSGVNIVWWHGDLATSKRKAREMVDGYGINNLKVAPALNSRHTQGKALDMEVTWTGTLKVKRKDKNGTIATITSTPRDSTNADLIAVAKTYGVIHFIQVAKDKVHWSTDGH